MNWQFSIKWDVITGSFSLALYTMNYCTKKNKETTTSKTTMKKKGKKEKKKKRSTKNNQSILFEKYFLFYQTNLRFKS